MLSLTISASVFLLVGYYFWYLGRHNDVSFDIRMGERCYSCKEKIPNWNLDFLDKEYLEMCTCCKRDESLDKVIGIKKKTLLNKVKKYLVSNRSRKLTSGLLIALVVFLIVDIISVLFLKMSWPSYVNNLINISFWSVMLYKQRLTTIKKIKLPPPTIV